MNEKKALEVYMQHMKNRHVAFELHQCGLFLSPSYPMLGASPDGVVTCKCCGSGIVEVKCPYSAAQEPLMDLILSGRSCLQVINNEVMLDRKHEYYYQIQLQLLMSKRNFCDFVVWSAGDWFCERITFDNSFIQNTIPKALDFFRDAVLIEVLGKWFTRPCQVPNVNDSDSVCVCGNSESMDTIIECQSGYCKVKMYHFSCLKLKNVPKRKWCCKDCRSVKKMKN